jgi:hypothetical protein
MRKALSILALASLSVAGAAQTIEDVSLGELWYGDPVSKEDLAGRVVFIEMWGKN